MKADPHRTLRDEDESSTKCQADLPIGTCHTLLAAASAGLDIPKLYVGSWSEWSRNKM